MNQRYAVPRPPSTLPRPFFAFRSQCAALLLAACVLLPPAARAQSGPDVTPPVADLVRVDSATLHVFVHDAGSGLADIRIIKQKNVRIVIPFFTAGTLDTVQVVVSKVVPKLPAVFVLEVVDMRDNDDRKDPVITSLTARSSISPPLVARQ